VQLAEVRFTPLRSSYNDDGGLRAEAVKLCWPLATVVAPLVAHSVHLYLEHREYGPHCDTLHTREDVVEDVVHSAG
jgi:hypothetical protein